LKEFVFRWLYASIIARFVHYDNYFVALSRCSWYSVTPIAGGLDDGGMKNMVREESNLIALDGISDSGWIVMEEATTWGVIEPLDGSEMGASGEVASLADPIGYTLVGQERNLVGTLDGATSDDVICTDGDESDGIH